MLKNGFDGNGKNIEMLEKILDESENYVKISILIITLLFLASLASLSLLGNLQKPKIMVIDTSSKENEADNEIKNFSIPEIIYKSFERKIKEKGNSSFKIITSVEKFNNMTFVEKNKELADIQKILRNNKIEKECGKDFRQLSSTIYCRKR